jgi:hypothetical protein
MIVARRRNLGLMVGALFTVLFAVTWLWPNWIELVIGADPDGGSGETEWSLLFAFGLVALAAWAIAGWEWRTARATKPAR